MLNCTHCFPLFPLSRSWFSYMIPTAHDMYSDMRNVFSSVCQARFVSNLPTLLICGNAMLVDVLRHLIPDYPSTYLLPVFQSGKRRSMRPPLLFSPIQWCGRLMLRVSFVWYFFLLRPCRKTILCESQRP